MSLSAEIQKLETDVKDGVQNAINWATSVVEEHLPGAVAGLKEIAGSKVFKLLEDAVLTPAEEELVTKFVTFVTSLRGQGGNAVPAEAEPADVPAAAAPAAGAAPVSGTAS